MRCYVLLCCFLYLHVLRTFDLFQTHTFIYLRHGTQILTILSKQIQSEQDDPGSQVQTAWTISPPFLFLPTNGRGNTHVTQCLLWNTERISIPLNQLQYFTDTSN